MKHKQNICFLTGLEIPKGEYSVDHYVAKYWLPPRLYSLKQNKVPAIKIINNIKGILMPCEWENQKYDLCCYALENYNLKPKNKNIIINALDIFENETNRINPCDNCILQTIGTQYCYSRPELKKYRTQWLKTKER